MGFFRRVHNKVTTEVGCKLLLFNSWMACWFFVLGFQVLECEDVYTMILVGEMAGFFILDREGFGYSTARKGERERLMRWL